MEEVTKLILKHLKTELAKENPELEKLNVLGDLLSGVVSSQTMMPPAGTK